MEEIITDKIEINSERATTWKFAKDIFRQSIPYTDKYKKMKGEEKAKYYAKILRGIHDILTGENPAKIVENPFYD